MQKSSKFGFRVFLIFLCSCADELSQDPQEMESSWIEEEGCLHLRNGPFLRAESSVSTQNAPDISFKHTAIQISKSNLESQEAEHVSYAAEHAGQFRLMFNAEVSLQVSSARDGEHINIVSTQRGSEACDLIRQQYVFDLEVGTYLLSFESVEDSTFTLVIEYEDGHAAHEGHRHVH